MRKSTALAVVLSVASIVVAGTSALMALGAEERVEAAFRRADAVDERLKSHEKGHNAFF